MPALAAALAALTLLPTLRARFLYDDTTIIRDNAGLRGWSALLLQWAEPYWPADGADTAGLYRPVHVSLIAAVWNAGKGAALPFHLYAVALYVVVVLLFWRLVRAGVGSFAASAAAVLWLATHPLHVEVVASVANTSELLVAALTVALVLLLLRAPQGREAMRARWVWTLAGGMLYAGAMLSKESGLLALPLAAITAWGWHPARSGPATSTFVRSNARLWIVGGVALAAVLLARWVVLGAATGHDAMVAPGLEGLSHGQRLRSMLSVWPRMAAMLAWPMDLSPYYGPTVLPPRQAARAALTLVAALGAGAIAIVLARRGERRALVALAWIALTYLPAANLFAARAPIVADRVLFGATIGVALGLAWLAERLRTRARTMLLLALTVVVVRNMPVRLAYALDWTSHRRLWTRLVETSPNEYLGYQLLGIDARQRGERARARELLGRAFHMAPSDPRGRSEYGQALYEAGEFATAARTLAPLLSDAQVHRSSRFVAIYLDAVGRAHGAGAVVAAGTELLRTAAAPVAALFVGLAHERLGRPAAADSAYLAGLRAQPTDSALLARRAMLLQRSAAQ